MTTKITEQNISNIANFAVDWQPVVTADGSTNTTAVSGKGYFIDTTSAAHTIVLPASPSFGDTIIINDYASTFGTNNVTINLNGNKLEADTTSGILGTSDQTTTLVYTDSTQGWKIVNQDTTSSIQPSYISATGGTVTTSGDYKIHTFTGDGCFVVSSLGGGIPCAQASTVDYVVLAGGGGGGGSGGNVGGGGGGGALMVSATTYCGPSLANCVPAHTITATTYPVTVGAGGAAGSGGGGGPFGTSGSNSQFSTLVAGGGGRGGCGGESTNPVSCGPSPQGDTPSRAPGNGSGGGGAGGNPSATGSPGGANGNPGGAGGGGSGGGGGGGGAAGAGSPSPGLYGGAVGPGDTITITGSSIPGKGQGGSGSGYFPGGPVDPPGPANSGEGGSGSGFPCGTGATGGSGIVIIRYKYQ